MIVSKYRRIYEDYHGPIPKGHHIHHIDGNHANNDIHNLRCVTAQEHYDIHYSQGDYGACYMMVKTGHLSITTEQRANLARLQAQDPKFNQMLTISMSEKSKDWWSNSEYRLMQSKACTERFTNLWKDDEYKEKVVAKIADSWNKEGRREKQAKEMSLAVAKYNNTELTCPHCGKVGRGYGIMNRWHFDRCKEKDIA